MASGCVIMHLNLTGSNTTVGHGARFDVLARVYLCLRSCLWSVCTWCVGAEVHSPSTVRQWIWQGWPARGRPAQCGWVASQHGRRGSQHHRDSVSDEVTATAARRRRPPQQRPSCLYMFHYLEEIWRDLHVANDLSSHLTTTRPHDQPTHSQPTNDISYFVIVHCNVHVFAQQCAIIIIMIEDLYCVLCSKCETLNNVILLLLTL